MITTVFPDGSLRIARLIIGLSLIVGAASCTNDIRQISQKRFLDMVKERQVKQMTIVNDQTVDVLLIPEALAGSKYASLFNSRDPLKKNVPHLRITIISERGFRNELAKINPAFPVKTEKRSLFDFLSK